MKTFSNKIGISIFFPESSSSPKIPISNQSFNFALVWTPVLSEYTFFAKKVYSDSTGVQTKAKLNDWLEIGILGEDELSGKKIEIPILLEKVFITDSVTTFTYNVNQKPVKALTGFWLTL